MASFRYKAVAADGGNVSGTLEAENRSLALRRLVRGGFTPVEVAEAGPEAGGKKKAAEKTGKASDKVDPSQPVRLKRQDLILFTEELSDLLEAGLPLEPALKSMESRGGNARLAAVSKRLRQSVIEGGSFGNALRHASPSFDELYCNLATAGEASGALPAILARQATYLASAAELRNKVVASLIYPAFLIAVAVGVAVLFLTVLLPDLTGLLTETGSSQPLGVRIIMGASDFLRAWWWAMLLVLGGAGWYGWWWTRQEKNRPAWDKWKLEAPLVGGLLSTSIQVQFLETLANLVSNGLPLLRGLELTKNTFANIFVRKRVSQACDLVADGASFSRALVRVEVFPAELVDMIAVGEKTGNLPGALKHAARRFDRELSARIQKLTALIQPAIIVVVALLVGTMVYLVISAIFQSFESLGKVGR